MDNVLRNIGPFFSGVSFKAKNYLRIMVAFSAAVNTLTVSVAYREQLESLSEYKSQPSDSMHCLSHSTVALWIIKAWGVGKVETGQGDTYDKKVLFLPQIS